MSKHIDIKQGKASAPPVPDTWRSFRREVDRLFDRFSDGFDSLALDPFGRVQRLLGQDRGFAAMAVDVRENDKTYVITAELPGVDEKNIDVSMDGDTLVIKGEKHHEKEEKAENHYLSERSYGSFQRMFALPAATDKTRIEARFNNGLLTINIPKTAASQNVRKIEVKAA